MIVVCGEALVDLVVAADGTVRAHPGGGPFNVARTVGRLGRPVTFLGRLSEDRFGEMLRAQLADAGVAHDEGLRTSAPTTLALAEVDAAGAARYRFYSEGTSATGLSDDAAARALPAAPQALCVGSLGLVLEPMASALESLVTAADERTLVAVDPNCRPAAVADPAGYRRRLERVLARADLLKASDEDLAWLAPGGDPVAAARALVRDRAAAVVTRGAAGATVVTAGDTYAVAAPRVEVVDTIGAGDAFMGGLLAALTSEGLADATAFACRVAALTCARAGADPPRLAEL